MSSIHTSEFSVNNRTYTPPNRPVVVICLDGSADEYLDAALVRGRMPHLGQICQRGFRGFARGALPSFTNVNNASIVTGTPPSVHGVSGNFFLDPETGEEVMMNSAKFLRAGTILAAAAQAGRKVAMVTAKEKLRDILSHDLTGIAFSSEKAGAAQEATHGISGVEEMLGLKTPDIYSGEASLFVLRAGVALIEQKRSDFLYLSLTDYMQHLYAPEAPEALDFYAAIDHELGRLVAAGAVVGATADHGMNAKQTENRQPNVIYLESLLTKEIGKGVRVILPITDPYVVHHGALGSFAVIHLPDPGISRSVQDWLMQFDEITEVYDRPTAARKLELPIDRIGDLVVMSRRDVVIGRTPEHHNLSALRGGLRSHGGRYEEMVPFIISEPLSPAYAARAQGDLRNFDMFDFVINGLAR
jgi:phosphonoacetate hydrolase